MVQARELAGLKVSPVRRTDVLEQARRALSTSGRLAITFLNPDYARRAMLDDELGRAINGFDLVLVDGNGVRLLAPLYGFLVPERLDTDSLAPVLFEQVAGQGGAVFLFGCAPGVAGRAGEKLAAAFPGLVVAGVEHGYHDVHRGHPGRFCAVDTDRIVADINASGARLLVVSLPAPLQQHWVAQNATRLAPAVIMTAGSYLDHVAEADDLTLSWYPRWADLLRLNWFYRLVREPRRLWRRYTVEVVHFAALVLRARLRGVRPADG